MITLVKNYFKKGVGTLDNGEYEGIFVSARSTRLGLFSI
jgi:hypothetical protein